MFFGITLSLLTSAQATILSLAASRSLSRLSSQIEMKANKG